MGNICEPYCSCNCNCENQKICKDCAEGCGNCLSCEGCHQCTECDPRLMNPCLIRETSSKDLMMVLKEFEFKGENDDKWFGKHPQNYFKSFEPYDPSFISSLSYASQFLLSKARFIYLNIKSKKKSLFSKSLKALQNKKPNKSNSPSSVD